MTNEYTVNVDKRTYHITVEHNNNPSQNHTDFSEELSYETTKAEYDHCFRLNSSRSLLNAIASSIGFRFSLWIFSIRPISRIS